MIVSSTQYVIMLLSDDDREMGKERKKNKRRRSRQKRRQQEVKKVKTSFLQHRAREQAALELLQLSLLACDDDRELRSLSLVCAYFFFLISCLDRRRCCCCLASFIQFDCVPYHAFSFARACVYAFNS